MTTDEISKLAELARAATPGPWVTANGKGSAVVRSEHPEYDCAIYLNVRTVEVAECVERWQRDAEYIAAISPPVLLSLLAKLAAVEAENARLARHVQVNDEEYITMKDVLRAEHEECKRLRVQLAAVEAARDELADIAERSVLIGQTALSDEGHDHDECEHWCELRAHEARIATLRKAGK